MRLAWATDIHLNFVDPETRRGFLRSLVEQSDAVAISGDIAESPDVGDCLLEMEQSLRRPIFFVLGNHDFYKGSIVKTRESIARLAERSDHLVYLTATGVIELTPNTALIGHDGWADARLGDFGNSNVVLNDYLLIQELNLWKEGLILDKDRLGQALRILGDEAAGHLETNLTEAAGKYANVIALIHVPPFRETAWYDGRISDEIYLPHFSCRAAGEALLRVMRSHPNCNLLVLCGHTHGGGEANLLDNLQVLTGAASYGSPAICRVFEVE